MSCLGAEMDVDVDNFSSGQVDRLNVIALEYGVAASSCSRSVSSPPHDGITLAKFSLEKRLPQCRPGKLICFV